VPRKVSHALQRIWLISSWLIVEVIFTYAGDGLSLWNLQAARSG
jgi:hypothetical protein